MMDPLQFGVIRIMVVLVPLVVVHMLIYFLRIMHLLH